MKRAHGKIPVHNSSCAVRVKVDSACMDSVSQSYMLRNVEEIGLRSDVPFEGSVKANNEPKDEVKVQFTSRGA